MKYNEKLFLDLHVWAQEELTRTVLKTDPYTQNGVLCKARPYGKFWNNKIIDCPLQP
jgi:hypothetical protein